jgi:hypothetical protein
MGRGDPRGGRPPVDGWVQAAIYGLAAEHPDWGSRRIATAAGCSRRTVQRYLRAGLGPLRLGGLTADRAPAGWLGQPDGLGSENRAQPALSAVRPMTPADHAIFDTYRGAAYESPGVMFWTFP